MAYSGEMIVTLKNGQKLSHREHINRGAAERPLANSEIVEKFRDNAATAFDAATVERMEAGVLGLEQASRAIDRLSALSPGVVR